MTISPPAPMMRAWAITAYGEDPLLRKLPVPAPEGADILIRMHGAEVGDWDELVRKGEWPMHRPFPLVLGLAGAGRVSALGPDVSHFRRHDAVYVYSYPLHDNGAWADYMRVPEPYVARAPVTLTLPQAGAVPIVGLTAHETIHDKLEVRKGDVVLITAAAGGVGHLAVQMATHLGAHVVAVAGTETVEFVRGLGAEWVVDHNREDVKRAILSRYPRGIPKALNSVPGDAANAYVDVMAAGGHLVDLPGEITAAKPGVRADTSFVVQADGARLARLADMLDDFLRVEFEEVFDFEHAPQALRRVLAKHVRGKLELRIVEHAAAKKEVA
jgi:NADPH:quinone reductase-like Zn-dependent oxidoreductase